VSAETPAYRYLLCDLLTDRVLADLPLTGVTFERRISRVGSLTATLQATNPELIAKAKALHDYAGRSALWVYRNGVLWWGGIVWTATAGQDVRGGVQVQLSAATFDSYAHHRLLLANVTYTQHDEADIICGLWRLMQAYTNSDIGVVADPQYTGTLRDRTYKRTDTPFVGKLIEDLGDVSGGPEHTIDVYLAPDGSRVKELRVQSRLGYQAPRVVFQRAAQGGGRVLSWSTDRDAVDAGTHFQVRGDAADGNVGQDVEPQLSTTWWWSDLIAAGWPRLDVVEDRSGVSDPQVLSDAAEGLSIMRRAPIPHSNYTVQVGDTGWNPNRVGEPVRLKLQDLWHTTTTDLTVRPVACKVTPAERGQPETVDLILGDD